MIENDVKSYTVANLNKVKSKKKTKTE